MGTQIQAVAIHNMVPNINPRHLRVGRHLRIRSKLGLIRISNIRMFRFCPRICNIPMKRIKNISRSKIKERRILFLRIILREF